MKIVGRQVCWIEWPLHDKTRNLCRKAINK